MYSRRGKYNQNFRKSAGNKIDISSQKHDGDFWFFSLYTHLQQQHNGEKTFRDL
jgi:hypothetical protein